MFLFLLHIKVSLFVPHGDIWNIFSGLISGTLRVQQSKGRNGGHISCAVLPAYMANSFVWFCPKRRSTIQAIRTHSWAILLRKYGTRQDQATILRSACLICIQNWRSQKDIASFRQKKPFSPSKKRRRRRKEGAVK